MVVVKIMVPDNLSWIYKHITLLSMLLLSHQNCLIKKNDPVISLYFLKIWLMLNRRWKKYTQVIQVGLEAQIIKCMQQKEKWKKQSSWKMGKSSWVVNQDWGEGEGKELEEKGDKEEEKKRRKNQKGKRRKGKKKRQEREKKAWVQFHTSIHVFKKDGFSPLLGHPKSLDI